MAETAIAKLALDTRAHGPYVCDNCDEENEDALLMSDASVVCPKCKTPLEAFQPFSDVIVSAAAIAPAGKRSRKSKRWAIQFESPDTSQEAVTAYDNMQDALEAGTDWIKDQANDDLMNDKLRKEENAEDDPWEEEDQERMELLESILKAIEERRLADAIEQWLEYQGDTDPLEKISIGPSGDVTDSDFEFRRAVEAESK